jgi:guanylate kinase
VGKGTLVTELRNRYPEVYVSISATTRSPRPGEIDKVHYYFIDDAAFDRLIAEDGLLEWAEVHGNTRYGTPREPVLQAVAHGKRVILEIDLQGARQVREKLPEAKSIFVLPPDLDALMERLTRRGTETPEQIERRLSTASYELAHKNEFDHIVVNDDLGQAVDELVRLIGL